MADRSEDPATMTLDVGGLASRRRRSRLARWRVPLCAAGALAVLGGGALFLASGGGGLAAADRGAGAPDGPVRQDLGPAGASGSAGGHGPGSASPGAGSPLTGPGGSPTPQGSPNGANRDGSTPQGASPDGDGGRPGTDPGSHSPDRPVPPGPPTPTPSDDTLRPGDRGAEVRTLQQRLYGQGFTYVEVSGEYDDRTRRGVVQLQSDRGLTGDPSGVYGPHTRAAFGLG
ncbi:peptidoglycan-binding domain-containing protein [Streptomyces sp. 5.8]|uniref:peptidoglycan-binding domain-containing protein n=1 Tax=Streptomyces sp. 5.8 TaxID=3406571 RepID=UPI003BB76BF4